MNTIHIFRDGKRYYYTYQNETIEINEITINKLVTKVQLPFTMTFRNISHAQRYKIVGKFIGNGIKLNVIGENKNSDFEISFEREKYEIDAYYIPSKVNLEGRNENCRPYILTTLGEHKILMEVTKDYIMNSSEPFYFLHSELTEAERNFFSPVYRKIECDYVYQLALQEEKPQILGRKKK